MLHFEFGQDRLTQPHPLDTFELAQGAVKVPLQARFVAEQVIELRGQWNVLPKRFQLQVVATPGALAAPNLTKKAGRSRASSSRATSSREWGEFSD